MLIKHSFIYTLARIVPGLLAFIALSIYTHLLTPEEYGIYTLILSGSVLIHNIIFDWLSVGTQRFWASKKYSKQLFTNTLALLMIAIVISLLGILIICLFFFRDSVNETWLFSIFFLIVGLAFFTISQTLLNVMAKPTTYASSAVSYSVLSVLLGSLFVYSEYGAIGVIMGITLGTVIPSVLIYKKAWHHFNKLHIDNRLFKTLFTYGVPITIITIAEELIFISDKLMIILIKGKGHVGLYAVSYDLSHNSILMVMGAINLAAYPVIVKLLANSSKEETLKYIKNYFIFFLAISVPSLVGLNLVGKDVINLIIDEQYRNSTIDLLPWISLASFLLGVQIFYLDLAFQLSYKIVERIKITIFTLIINLALNYLLIPILGVKGAAFASLLSILTGIILSIISGRKLFKLPFPWKDSFKIIVSSLVMSISIIAIRNNGNWTNLMVQILTGSFCYMLMAYLLNIYDFREIINQFKK